MDVIVNVGFEYSGHVAETGPDVSGFAVGDHVIGNNIGHGGSYTQEVIADDNSVITSLSTLEQPTLNSGRHYSSIGSNVHSVNKTSESSKVFFLLLNIQEIYFTRE